MLDADLYQGLRSADWLCAMIENHPVIAAIDGG
jgi:hypothetical protein